MKNIFLIIFFCIFEINISLLSIKNKPKNKIQSRKLFTLLGSSKTKEHFNMKKYIKTLQEEIAQNIKDTEEYDDIKSKIQVLYENVERIQSTVQEQIDKANSNLMTLGYS